ncbi:MAG: nuclear transport factor 2 family protein [Sphingomonas sp.]|jgi:ketosteroid isomerase-like protein
MTARETALAFMNALWAGDMNAAGALLTEDAIWLFQLGMPQAHMRESRIWPAREAMQSIVDDLFGKFDPEGFTVTVTRTIAEGEDVAIAYEANGRVADGRPYHNFYVTLLRVRHDKVCEVSPQNDTAHMLAMLA